MHGSYQKSCSLGTDTCGSSNELKDLHLCPIMSECEWVVVVVIVWQLVLQLPMQSIHTTTNVVSTSPAHGEVLSIHSYVIKFVSELWQVGNFLWVLRFPLPLKLTAKI